MPNLVRRHARGVPANSEEPQCRRICIGPLDTKVLRRLPLAANGRLGSGAPFQHLKQQTFDGDCRGHQGWTTVAPLVPVVESVSRPRAPASASLLPPSCISRRARSSSLAMAWMRASYRPMRSSGRAPSLSRSPTTLLAWPTGQGLRWGACSMRCSRASASTGLTKCVSHPALRARSTSSFRP